AEAIAKNTNSQVGAVRSAQTGVFQITSRNSTEVSDMGTYDTSSIDKDITAVVSISFSMK
ncbi:MAG: SIMPL domain-containing protein, partial [Microcystaceae cyanobacterium]